MASRASGDRDASEQKCVSSILVKMRCANCLQTLNRTRYEGSAAIEQGFGTDSPITYSGICYTSTVYKI